MMIASVIMTLVTSPSLAWTVAVAMPFLVLLFSMWQQNSSSL